MKCYSCGNTLQDSYYSHFFKTTNNCQFICQECFNKFYWDDVLNDPNTLIINGFAYCGTNSAKTGGYGNREFTIKILKTGEIKKVGLWMNGKIPEAYHREDTAQFIV